MRSGNRGSAAARGLLTWLGQWPSMLPGHHPVARARPKAPRSFAAGSLTPPASPRDASRRRLPSSLAQEQGQLRLMGRPSRRSRRGWPPTFRRSCPANANTDKRDDKLYRRQILRAAEERGGQITCADAAMFCRQLPFTAGCVAEVSQARQKLRTAARGSVDLPDLSGQAGLGGARVGTWMLGSDRTGGGSTEPSFLAPQSRHRRFPRARWPEFDRPAGLRVPCIGPATPVQLKHGLMQIGTER
jgi:hypothetical protein